MKFLLKSGAVTALKVFSVTADFFSWRTETISLLLVRHLVARLLDWILEWLCSRHSRKQISNSKVFLSPRGTGRKGKAGGISSQGESGRKTSEGKVEKSIAWKILSYQEACFRAILLLLVIQI